MIFLSLFLVELLLLYIVSRILNKQIFKVFDSLLHNRKRTMYMFAILFLPGTLIHELSHFLMATILLVPTGEISILPKLEQNKINMGHVEIGKTDLFRRFLIGVAPFLVGITVIFSTIYFLQDYLHDPIALLIIIFVMFEVGNTMFSSKRDWEGAWKVLIVFAAIIATFYILNISLHEYLFTEQVIAVIQTATVFILVPVAIDLVLAMFLKVI